MCVVSVLCVLCLYVPCFGRVAKGVTIFCWSGRMATDWYCAKLSTGSLRPWVDKCGGTAVFISQVGVYLTY